MPCRSLSHGSYFSSEGAPCNPSLYIPRSPSPRRHYFGKKFQNVINAARKNGDLTDEEAQTQPVLARLRTWLSARAQNAVREGGSRATSKSSDTNNKGGIVRKLKPEMIRRMDNAPQLVNPSGWISDAVPVKKTPTTVQAPPAPADSSASPQQRAYASSHTPRTPAHLVKGERWRVGCPIPAPLQGRRLRVP